jgi:hypothetical protein
MKLKMSRGLKSFVQSKEYLVAEVELQALLGRKELQVLQGQRELLVGKEPQVLRELPESAQAELREPRVCKAQQV